MFGHLLFFIAVMLVSTVQAFAADYVLDPGTLYPGPKFFGGPYPNPTQVDYNNSYIPVTQYTAVPGGTAVAPQFVNTNSLIASSPAVSSLVAANAYMASQISKAYELSAISASMGDAIPNPGDRFALRINVAGFSGQTGGSLGFSYNFAPSARLSINYGQGATTSVVSGGMNFSFH